MDLERSEPMLVKYTLNLFAIVVLSVMVHPFIDNSEIDSEVGLFPLITDFINFQVFLASFFNSTKRFS